MKAVVSGSGKKKPLYLILGITMALAVAAYSLYENWAVTLDDYADYILKREKYIRTYAHIGETLGSLNKLEELRLLLIEARDERYIDYFILQYKGEPLYWGTADGKIGALDTNFEVLNEMVVNPGASYLTVPVRESLLLTIGINKSETGYFRELMAKYYPLLIEQALAVVLISVSVFLYFLHDILQFLNLLSSRDKRRFKKIKTKSRESEILAQGLASYEQTVDALTLQNQTLGRQVLPSLKKEILSGKKPPYDFDCTMVRTDINNFSSIYNNHDVGQFMAVINSFFEDVSHIVSRYKGLIHEFVGDEVIFYFKDEDHENSFMIALAAIRDINAVAGEYHKRTMQEDGYPFTVKSSLAHGTIRFGPLVNGYSLAGSVLIETVRILSHVVEKEGNVVYFDSANLKRVSELFDVREASRVQLKGFNGTRTLYSCGACRSVASVLGGLSESTVHDLTYYRSDSDICQALEHFRTKSAEVSPSLLSQAIQVMRDFRVTKSDRSVRDHLIQWMDDLSSASETCGSRPLHRTLSATVMLAINLVSRENYDQEFEGRLSGFLGDGDKRVVANVLEVMTHFKSDTDEDFLRRVLTQDNNRVAANALVHEGIHDLSPFVVKQLRKMLKGKSPAYTASALFAIGELAAYHRSHDVVYYSTHIEFLQLVQMLPTFVSHNDPMVRRQALIAAKKAQEAKVLQAILAQATEPDSQLLRREVEQYIGDPDTLLGEVKSAA